MRRFPIAGEGFVFIVPALLLAALLFGCGLYLLAIAAFLLFFFFLYFFRNPERVCACKDDELLSPADGKVMGIDRVTEEEFIGNEMTRISIFMSVSDVHVNRAPCAGSIARIEHKNGLFRLAFKRDVEKENERNYVLLEGKGERFLLVQIAGFLARRIICYVKEKDSIGKGEPFGMIAFGSRVDIYMPLSYTPMVQLGQKVKSGLTTLAGKKGDS